MLDESKVWTGTINANAGTAIEGVAHVGLYDSTLRDGEQTVGVNLGPEAKLEIARALAQEIAQGAPLALAAVKEVVRETEGLDLPESYAQLRSGRLAAYERMLTSEDAQEGPRAFAEKRPPVWRGR